MPEIKIGLEVHGYLAPANRTKLFCDDTIELDAPPNTTICPICTGQPGSKPMLPNKDALDIILLISLLLNCTTNKRLLFQRKHYSWPDMPNNFQRTMSGTYSVPVGEHGKFLGIGIREVHLEEDPARWDPVTGFVDYNRSGYPLVEIVTEPDFTSVDQLREWLKNLITALSYIKAIDRQAGIKADVNVSIGPEFTRVEVKNINSFRAIVDAAAYEVARQGQEKDRSQHTRAWDSSTGSTVFMRGKEGAEDYMFIPEPDLPAIPVTAQWLSQLRAGLPETPEAKIQRYVKELKIDPVDAKIIAYDLFVAELFEKTAKLVSPVLAARWTRRELLRVLNDTKIELEDSPVTPAHFAELLEHVARNELTPGVARKLLSELVQKPFDVKAHVEKEGLHAVADESELEKLAEQAIAENPGVVSDYKSGREEAVNFLVGKVMRATNGRAQAGQVKKILKQLLSEQAAD